MGMAALIDAQQGCASQSQGGRSPLGLPATSLKGSFKHSVLQTVLPLW